MTFEEALAAQPAWVNIWVTWLGFGAFILPLALLIWKETRFTAVVTVIASLIAAIGVMQMFERMGYVKLLGLPHIILWLPLSVYLWKQLSRPDVRLWPKRILWVVLVTIGISLAFDIVDVARYALGEREAFTP
ncbi:MAG: hypothetical protein AAFN43_09665 [Pseudomonadota bacterium]